MIRRYFNRSRSTVIAISIFVASTSIANAQDFELAWAESIGGTSTDGAEGIFVDDSENVYVVGTFEGTVDFDPGVGTANRTSAGGRDVFIQKFDQFGNLHWVRSIGSASKSELAHSISVDSGGSVYVAGLFFGTVDFDPGVGTANITPTGSPDVFILRLDPNGNFEWARNLAGTSSAGETVMAHDSSDNVYVAGKFGGTTDFDPSGSVVNRTPVGSNDIFVLKLNSAGIYQWVNTFGGSGDDNPYDIAIDAFDNVITAGAFVSTMDINPGGGTTNVTSAGGDDAFVQKVDRFGTFSWGISFGNTGGVQAFGVDTDASGNVYTTGTFSGTVDFDPGAGTANIAASGSVDTFVQRLDAAGNFEWGRNFGSGTTTTQSRNIQLGANGNVYINGYFNFTADFDPSGDTFNLTAATSNAIYLAVLDSAGLFVDATTFGKNDGSIDFVAAASGDVYTAGYVTNSGVDWDPGSGSTTLTTDGSFDILVHKLGIPPSAASIVRANTSPSNNTSVNFTVTFDESVSGVDTSDFTIDSSGVTGATVDSVSGSGNSYTVTVLTASGDGSLSIDLVDDDTIVDDDNIPLGGTGANNGDFAAGEAYTVDKTAPTVGIGAPSVTDTMGGPVTFDVTYTGADSVNLVGGNVTLNATGTASATVGVTNSTTATPTVTLSSITGDGTLGITIAGGAASDIAGNTDAGAGPSATVNVDNTAPGISIGAPSVTDTNSGPVSYTVTYTGADSVTLAPGDVTLNTTGDAAGTVTVNGAGSASRTVTVDSITGDGTIGISVGSGTGSDAAGNTTTGAGPSGTFNVDNTPPAVGAVVVSAGKAGPIDFDVTFSEPVTGVDNSDFALTTTGGVTGVSVTNVAGSDSAYMVTVDSGSGSGTIRLDVTDDDSIIDGTGNPLGGPGVGNGDFTAGEVFNTAASLPTASEWGQLLLGLMILLGAGVAIRRALRVQPSR